MKRNDDLYSAEGVQAGRHVIDMTTRGHRTTTTTISLQAPTSPSPSCPRGFP